VASRGGIEFVMPQWDRMKLVFLAITLIFTGCDTVTITQGTSISAEELEQFFRKHQIDNNMPVALKKRSLGDGYLATIHGYPDNLSVCMQLIEPYNKNPKMSDIPGTYFCEELR